MRALQNITLCGIISVFLLSGCQNNKPVWRNGFLETETSVKIESWDKFFAAQPKIDTFKILNTGAVKVPLSGMLNTKKLPKNHGLDEFLWVDVFVFLFHHQDHGWFLIDTGLDSTFQSNGNISGAIANHYIKATKQAKGQNIRAQLQKENKLIKGIFFTHLHGDHTAGLPEISATIPKYAGKGEKFIYIPVLYQSNHLSAQDTLNPINWDNAETIHPFNEVIDLFNDRSLLAIHTPGHSAGHTSYILNTTAGAILLTGDASHTAYGFKNNIEPGWTDNQQAAEESLRQLKTFIEMFPKTTLVYGHEK
ncbi:MBL fold metallo-hydrolase [Bacteroidota bacterium]